MNTIKLIRKNDYMNYALTFDVYVNNVLYKLNNDSTLDVNISEEKTEIFIKYLWIKSEKINVDTISNKFEIIVKPCFSNKVLIFAFITFALSFLLLVFSNNQLSVVFFRIVVISFFLSFIYFLTIGRKNYFILDIKKTWKI